MQHSMSPFDDASRVLHQLRQEIDELRQQVAALRAATSTQQPTREVSELREQLVSISRQQQRVASEVSHLNTEQQRCVADIHALRDHLEHQDQHRQQYRDANAAGVEDSASSQLTHDIINHHANWMKSVNDLQAQNMEQLCQLNQTLQAEMAARKQAEQQRDSRQAAELQALRDTYAKGEDNNTISRLNALQGDLIKVVNYLQVIGAAWDGGLRGLKSEDFAASPQLSDGGFRSLRTEDCLGKSGTLGASLGHHYQAVPLVGSPGCRGSPRRFA